MITEEQNNIINSKERRIKVNALAGSGKTFTVTQYLRRQEGRKLYLVFNRIMKTEAESKLIMTDTDVYTTYGIAFKDTGRYFSNRLGDLSISTVKNITHTDFDLSKMILECFNKYLVSDIDNLKDFSPRLYPYTSKLLSELIKNKNIYVPHALYLKMWCISKPKLDYDIIVVDEFQDVPKCLIKVLKEQTCHKILVVGDSNQNIYSSLTYTTNGLMELDWKEYSLTETFRFNGELCNKINEFMNDCNREINIRSSNNSTQITSFNDCNKKKHYRIFRKNKSIILDAIENVDRKINIDDNVKELCKLISAVSRYREHETRSKYIPKYIRSFNMLEKMAIGTDNNDLLTACSLAKQIESIYELTDNLILKSCSESDCHIKYTTSHKSKGLTISNPVIVFSEDFYLNKNDTSDIEVINLFYVALTRASGSIYIFPFEVDKFMLGNKLE